MADGDLLTLDELRRWTQDDIEDESDVQFAQWVITTVSNGVRFYAEREWERSDAPSRALDLAAIVARRGYLNPNQETRTQAIGPIGGVGYDKSGFGAGIAFTPSEIDELETLGLGTSASRTGGLWVQRIEHPRPSASRDDVIRVPLSSSPDVASYPYFDPNDPIVRSGE